MDEKGKMQLIRVMIIQHIRGEARACREAQAKGLWTVANIHRERKLMAISILVDI